MDKTKFKERMKDTPFFIFIYFIVSIVMKLIRGDVELSITSILMLIIKYIIISIVTYLLVGLFWYLYGLAEKKK